MTHGQQGHQRPYARPILHRCLNAERIRAGLQEATAAHLAESMFSHRQLRLRDIKDLPTTDDLTGFVSQNHPSAAATAFGQIDFDAVGMGGTAQCFADVARLAAVLTAAGFRQPGLGRFLAVTITARRLVAVRAV